MAQDFADCQFLQETRLRRYAHTSRATSTQRPSLAHCSSSANRLPSSVLAKPHCGERQSCSRAANFAASSMRRLSWSLLSNAPVFDVMTPSTTCLFFGRKPNGSKPPVLARLHSLEQ